MPVASRIDATPIDKSVECSLASPGPRHSIKCKHPAKLDSAAVFSLPSSSLDLHSPPVANPFHQELSMNRRVWILFICPWPLYRVHRSRRFLAGQKLKSKRRAINCRTTGPGSFQQRHLAGDTLYLAGSIGPHPKTGKSARKIEA